MILKAITVGVGFRRTGTEEKPQKHTLSSWWVNKLYLLIQFSITSSESSMAYNLVSVPNPTQTNPSVDCFQYRARSTGSDIRTG